MSEIALNILLIHGWWRVERPGGVISMMKSLTTELRQHHQVITLVNNWDTPEIKEDCEDDDLVYSLRLRGPYDKERPWRGLLGWLKDFPGTVQKVRGFIRAQKIDVVHLHLAASYQLYFWIVRLLGGPPYIVTLHRGDILGFRELHWIDRFAMRLVLKGAAQVIAVSAWLARTAEETIPDIGPVKYIYNGLNPEDFLRSIAKPLPADLVDRLPERYFIIVANLHPYKGHDVAIRAWSLLRNKQFEAHLIIAGAGDHESEYKELAEQLGVKNLVHFLGHVSRQHLSQLMQRAVGLVLPSRNEGLPYVPLEAGMVHVPIICTNIGPFTEIVRDEETALVVPVDDPPALAAAAIKLYQDKALAKKLAQGLYERVMRDFLAETMTKRYIEIYRQAISGTVEKSVKR